MQTKNSYSSIRIKLLKAVLIPLILLSLIMGFSTVIMVNKLAKDDAAHLMVQVCEKETFRFDSKLSLVKHSVSTVYEFIEETNQSNKYELFTEDYEKKIREFAVSVSNQTDGAIAVYYRYNPKLTGTGTGGFFWSKLSGNDVFTEQPATDILAYNSSDIEHVGWFYVPKETMQPLWMKPYYNQNLDVFMISYIIPVYSENREFLGVVGMDIDFYSIMEAENTVTLYDTGKLAFVDLSEHLIYSSDDGVPHTEKLPNKLYNHITTVNKSSDILEITENNGEENVICCRRLLNGMMLYVTVPKNEIFANRNKLILFMTVLSVSILIVAICNIRKHTGRIVEPVNHLAELTDFYANGDWEHSYVCDSGDEVQKLSESIEIMAKNTQKYLSSINNLARTDGLTGLKNKTSYLEWVNDVKMNRHNDYDKYALVVMDLNLLKKANDNYGHEAGDALLKEASQYICHSFEHSPAFRIGGDEFVVILARDDYKKRAELCIAFEEGMNYEVDGAGGVRLSVSYGLASFPEDASDYDELFRIADDRMYAKKKEMKMERKD